MAKQIPLVSTSVTNADIPSSTKCPGFPMIDPEPNQVAKRVTPTNDVDKLLPANVKSVAVLIRLEAQKPMASVTAI